MQAKALTSWKEIANYLGKGVRTVQRWERELQLPVRRPCGSEKHVVLALRSELDTWVRDRMHPRQQEPTQDERLKKLHYLSEAMEIRVREITTRTAALMARADEICKRTDALREASRAVISSRKLRP